MTRKEHTLKNNRTHPNEMVGKQFKHYDTGRVATVVDWTGPNSWDKLILSHESGRTTKKLKHYFDYDFYEFQ